MSKDSNAGALVADGGDVAERTTNAALAPKNLAVRHNPKSLDARGAAPAFPRVLMF